MKDAWRQIGEHQFHVTGNLVYARWIGRPEVAELVAAYQLIDEVFAQHGPVYTICDMQNAGIPTLEGRRYMNEWMRKNPNKFAAMTCYGMSTTVLAILKLIRRAAVLLNASHAETEFFSTEAEALAWLEARRGVAASTPG